MPAPLQAAGYTIELLNEDGQIVATALTDRNGHYRFTQLSGSATDPSVASGLSATGTYTVACVLPSGDRLTSPAPKPINLTHGDTNISNVNFQMTLASSQLVSATTLANSMLA
jgi:hypothetical protein